jgi:hypothetical protein
MYGFQHPAAHGHHCLLLALAAHKLRGNDIHPGKQTALIADLSDD